MIDETAVANGVDAAATLLAMPLGDDRRAAVIATTLRLATFAADVAAVEVLDYRYAADEARP